MQSKDWLILPVFRNIYPEHIYSKAKMVGVDPKIIAENERVEPGRTILKAIPYDMLELIIDVEEFDEFPNSTLVMFGDEEMNGIIVMWPITKFIKTLDKFMTGEPCYRNINESTQTIQFHPYLPTNPQADPDEETDEE